MQALNVGDTLIDTFTVTTVDGTAQVVTVTINGADDAAVISGETTGSVIEAGGVGSGIPASRSRPAISTPRSGQPAGRLDHGYHTDARRRRLRQLHPERGRRVDLHARRQQSDGAGNEHRRQLTDTFTATTVDGTAQLVTITIHGTDDAAVISGDFSGTVSKPAASPTPRRA